MILSSAVWLEGKTRRREGVGGVGRQRGGRATGELSKVLLRVRMPVNPTRVSEGSGYKLEGKEA